MDSARAHRAKQELHAERDVLLKRADHRVDAHSTQKDDGIVLAIILLDAHSTQKDDGKNNARALLWTCGLLLLPSVAYISIMLAWFFTFHDSIAKFLAIFVCCLAASVVVIVLSFRWLTGKARPWLWWVGFFTFQASLAALVIGFFLYYRNLICYWNYNEMRSYTNVAAAQDDAAFPDAYMFLFTEDTRLDIQRAVGYKSRWTGKVYCVAPLVDTTMSAVEPIYYWAIGEDCCEARSDFHCGDAQDPSTRSGLVALKPAKIVRPYMRWAVRGSPYQRFEKAVRLEEATHVTQAAPDPTFIYWSSDPIALKDSFYKEAVHSCVLWSLIYFAVLLVLSCFTAWRRLVPQRKHAGVMRYAD